jgi:hypothetical protein
VKALSSIPSTEKRKKIVGGGGRKERKRKKKGRNLTGFQSE